MGEETLVLALVYPVEPVALAPPSAVKETLPAKPVTDRSMTHDLGEGYAEKSYTFPFNIPPKYHVMLFLSINQTNCLRSGEHLSKSLTSTSESPSFPFLFAVIVTYYSFYVNCFLVFL